MRGTPAMLIGCAAASLMLAGCAPQGTSTPPPAASASATPKPTNSPATPPATPTATATATTTATALRGRTIVIDPGHTGGWTSKWGYHKVPDGRGGTKACNSSGTATRSGYAEHAYNLAQAEALADALRDRGATVLLTRDDDRTVSDALCVNHRADLLNTHDADLLISLHADGNLGSTHRGFHVIISTAMHGGAAVITESKKLATDVRNALQAQTPMPRSNYIGGGTGFSFRSDLGTLNFAEKPAVMIEMGNMMNANDAALLTSASFRTDAAAAIASAVASFLS